VERLRPHVDRVRPTRDPEMQPTALQLAELGRDLADQNLALGVAAEAPGLRGEPVPGHDLRAGAGDVPFDRPECDVGLVRRQPPVPGQRTATTGAASPLWGSPVTARVTS